VTKISKPNQEALNRLVARASETHTDAMIIVQNGTTLGEWNFDKEKRPDRNDVDDKVDRLSGDWKAIHREENQFDR
jgi:hypothetical protein